MSVALLALLLIFVVFLGVLFWVILGGGINDEWSAF